MKTSKALVSIIILTATLNGFSQAPQQPPAGQQPGGMPPSGAPGGGMGMAGLVNPTTVKPIDNSTSIILDNFTLNSTPINALPEGSGLELTKDIIYHQSKDLEGKPMSMKMDLITYNDGIKRPCVIFITGGGFMMAPKSSELYKRFKIAEAGYVVGSIEYHVINNGIYSDAVKDVKAAVRFVRANADKYGIDASKVAVWGESAGGYLTAMVGTTNGLKEFEDGENPDQSSAVQACIDVYGLSDLTKIGADYDEAAEKSHFTVTSPDGQYLHGKNSGLTSLDKPEVAAKANPVNYVDKNDPPFLFFHGSNDRLVSPSQTLLVHTALLKAGVESTRYVVTGAGHGGPQYSSPEVLKIMIDFLNRELK
jgi:acetyl esterase/lipase